MPNYNKTLQTNNSSLEEIIVQLNNLPDAGEGGTDTSDATATASDIMSGKTAYIGSGKATGTFSIDNELATQDDLIAQIQSALQGKAGGGIEIDESQIIEKTVSGGQSIYIYDASEIPHKGTVQLSSDTITDFSGIKVYVPNGNMFDKTSAENTTNWSTIINNYYYFPIKVGKGIPVTVSYQQGLDLGLGLYATVTLDMQSDGWGATALYHSTGTSNIHQTVTVTSQSEYIYLRVNNINKFMQYIGNQLKVEVGTKATEYEEYSATPEYEANADGVIEGINMVYPLMVVYADENVNISISYRKSYGMQREYDNFWDVYQQNGNRTMYNNAFASAGWTKDNFKPKYNIKPTNAYMMFYDATNLDVDLVEVCENQGITMDFSACTNFNYFSSVGYAGNKIRRFGVIDARANANNLNNNIFTSSNVQTIDELIVNENNKYATGTFGNCKALENLKITGTIGQNNFNVSSSTKLSKASIVSIVNALSTTTSGLSITLSKTAVNSAFATTTGGTDGSTSAEWTALVATRSNWTISLV
jgi:hypothetical protein